MSLVSVITPAYNSAKFIEETIASVRSQTYSNWEMLVIDDCSEDNTCEVVEKIATVDRRIKLIRLRENVGVGMARNIAIKAAKGRFIAFLDSDDLWLPQKLEKQIKFMIENNVAFSYTQYQRILENGNIVSGIVTIPKSLTYWELLKNTAIAILTVVIDIEKTGLIEMVSQRSYSSYADLLLWLSLLKKGLIAYGIQENLALYRIVEGSMSSNKLKNAIGVWKIYRQIEKLNLPVASWCFINYAWRGYMKYKHLI